MVSQMEELPLGSLSEPDPNMPDRPVILVADQGQAEATLAHLIPERRAQVRPATPAEAAEILKPYLDAGFGGFIFRNTTMLTPDAIGLAGELIGLMR